MLNKVKNQRGVTLVALTIYIIIFIIIIGIVTTISTYFYSGIGEVVDTPKYLSEFNKFTMFFVADIKNYNNAEVTNNKIVFQNGPTYTYKDEHIYRNDVEIAKYIMSCTFSPKKYAVDKTTKNLINVDMKIGKNDKKSVEKNIDFTLRYW